MSEAHRRFAQSRAGEIRSLLGKLTHEFDRLEASQGRRGESKTQQLCSVVCDSVADYIQGIEDLLDAYMLEVLDHE